MPGPPCKLPAEQHEQGEGQRIDETLWHSRHGSEGGHGESLPVAEVISGGWPSFEAARQQSLGLPDRSKYKEIFNIQNMKALCGLACVAICVPIKIHSPLEFRLFLRGQSGLVDIQIAPRFVPEGVFLVANHPGMDQD